MVENENIKIEQEVLNSYKIANDYAIHMDKSIWTRFNTLLVVNGLILVFWRNIDDEILSIIISIIGILLNLIGCLFWLKRAIKYKERWLDIISEIETKYIIENKIITETKAEFERKNDPILGKIYSKYECLNNYLPSGTILITALLVLPYIYLFIKTLLSLLTPTE